MAAFLLKGRLGPDIVHRRNRSRAIEGVVAGRPQHLVACFGNRRLRSVRFSLLALETTGYAALFGPWTVTHRQIPPTPHTYL